MDAETKQRVTSWGAGSTSPVYEAVDRLFPTFLDLFEFVEKTYTGLVYGDALRADFAAGTGQGSAGTGSPFPLSLVADMRAAYDMGIQRDNLEQFSVLIYALNLSGIRSRMAFKADESEDVLREEVFAILSRVDAEGGRWLAQGSSLFTHRPSRKGTTALLDAGFTWEDLVDFPVDFTWDFDDAEGEYYSVNEAIRLHKAGVSTEYALEMAEALDGTDLPPIAEYFAAGVPAYYAVAALRAGRAHDEVIGLWESSIPLEYATA